MEKYITIKEASVLIGVTTTTLRRWETSGLFIANHRTFGNHRRYKLQDVLDIVKPNETNTQEDCLTVGYARVSTHGQKDNLTRQSQTLKNYCESNNYKNIQIIEDIGSGLNYNKKGLTKLLKLIMSNKVDKIILTHKDRLLRFGSDLLINVAKHFNTETIILNHVEKTFEEQLSGDVLEIITVFSAKLHGKRSHKSDKK